MKALWVLQGSEAMGAEALSPKNSTKWFGSDL